MKQFLVILSMVFIAIFFSLPVSEAQVKSSSPKEVTIIDQDEIPDILPEVKAKPGWPKELTIGIAPVGGTYYIWGGGFAKLLEEKVGIPGYMVVTGGPLQNTKMVDSKKLYFGMVTSSPVWEGWHGEGLGGREETSEYKGDVSHVCLLFPDVRHEKVGYEKRP